MNPIKQRSTRAKRKLLSPNILNWIAVKLELGVPLAKLCRQLELTMTRRAVATLVEQYNLSLSDDKYSRAVHNSLFPAWLDVNNTNAQENPVGWVYVGRFPFGYWAKDADDRTVH
jgi:hypothetical protein